MNCDCNRGIVGNQVCSKCNGTCVIEEKQDNVVEKALKKAGDEVKKVVGKK